jgi:hypothetical protein
MNLRAVLGSLVIPVELSAMFLLLWIVEKYFRWMLR